MGNLFSSIESHQLRFFNSTDLIYIVEVDIETLKERSTDVGTELGFTSAAQPIGLTAKGTKTDKYTAKELLFHFNIEPYCSKVVEHQFNTSDLRDCRINFFVKLPKGTNMLLIEKLPFSSGKVFFMRQASVIAIDGNSVLYEANNASETIDLLEHQYSRSLYEGFVAKARSIRISNCFLIYEYLSKFEDSSNNSSPDKYDERMGTLITDRISEEVQRKLFDMYVNTTIVLYQSRLYIRKNPDSNFDDLTFIDGAKIFPDLSAGYWVQSSVYDDFFVELNDMRASIRRGSVTVGMRKMEVKQSNCGNLSGVAAPVLQEQPELLADMKSNTMKLTMAMEETIWNLDYVSQVAAGWYYGDSKERNTLTSPPVITSPVAPPVLERPAV